MSCISGLLTTICPEIEQYLKPNLRGIQGLVIAGFLPQVWTFESEHETVSLVVGREGNAFVQVGGRADRDVTVRLSHDYLASVLRTRSAASIPAGVRPVVMFHTAKGRSAFNYLRGRLGL